MLYRGCGVYSVLHDVAVGMFVFHYLEEADVSEAFSWPPFLKRNDVGSFPTPKSIPTSGTFFCEDLVMKILGHFFSSAVQEEQLSVKGERIQPEQVNFL